MKRLLLTLVLSLSAHSMLLAEGRVRIVHASPDAPAVDIYVDGQAAVEALPYGEATDYLTVPDGDRRFEVFVAGTRTRVTEVPATIERNGIYSVIAIGFATGNRNPGFRVILLPDNYEGPNDGQAYIRFVHASPSAPPVDIYVGGVAFQAVTGRMPLLESFPFGIATGYVAVPAGTYFARLTPAGTKTIALDSGRVMLPSRGVRTAVALDGRVLLLMD